MKRSTLILFFVFTYIGSYAQINFDSNFENASLDTAYLDSSSFRLWPITNLHFRITNALNEQPSFKIFDSLGYQLRSYHYMVYRYEGDSNWNYFDTAYKANAVSDYFFTNLIPFTQDTVYISYWFPYTYSNLQNYLSGFQNSVYLKNFGVKTHSFQNRNIYGYEITDTSVNGCIKQNVVITARQHPTEFINGYFIEGLTDYLLYSTDSIAELIRKNFHFFIYPMLNPDGVVNGIGTNVFGQDLNRSWEDSLIISNIPESDSIRPVIWNETNQRIDWSIDIHSNAGNNQPYYWWGYTNSSPVPVWQQNEALKYVQSVSNADTSGLAGQSLFQNFIQGNGVGSSKTAANWFRKWFNAIAFTFEPTTEPLGPIGDNRLLVENLKLAGASLAKGFADVVDTIQSLNGQVISGANYLIVQINGGSPPYNINWTGPVNGNSDTLINAVNGTYTIHVSDSKGCLWNDTVLFNPTNTNLSSDQNKVLVFPNPATDLCRIELNKKATQLVLKLYDLMGMEILNFSLSNIQQLELDLSDLITGTYFIKLRSDKFSSYHKLVVY